MTQDEIEQILGVKTHIDDWWAYWEYVPDGNDELCPNFKAANDAYLKLFNEPSLEEFTTKCATKIIELLNK
ncbi:hypothetical protein [Acetoanaerobium noterae]|uniref:hypothetical protein n=1 Tax=Acetoanaerobium noterae TaxID=745369 RepID=UPI00322158E5